MSTKLEFLLHITRRSDEYVKGREAPYSTEDFAAHLLAEEIGERKHACEVCSHAPVTHVLVADKATTGQRVKTLCCASCLRACAAVHVEGWRLFAYELGREVILDGGRSEAPAGIQEV